MKAGHCHGNDIKLAGYPLWGNLLAGCCSADASCLTATQQSLTLVIDNEKAKIINLFLPYFSENFRSSALSSSSIPVFFFFKYMGGRATCRRCVSSTRHEYGVLTSLQASAKVGIKQEIAASSLTAVYVFSKGTDCVDVDISVDIFAWCGSSSSCCKFAMLP